jgi:hypothetical protein
MELELKIKMLLLLAVIVISTMFFYDYLSNNLESSYDYHLLSLFIFTQVSYLYIARIKN